MKKRVVKKATPEQAADTAEVKKPAEQPVATTAPKAEASTPKQEAPKKQAPEKKKAAPVASSPAPQESSSSNRPLTWALAAGMIMLVAGSTYMYTLYSSAKKENDEISEQLSGFESQKKQELEQKDNKIQEMIETLQKQKDELARLGQSNEDLQGQIAELESLRSQLREARAQLSYTRAELREAQANQSSAPVATATVSSSGKVNQKAFEEKLNSALAKHQAELAARDKQISELKRKNRVLTHQNRQLVDSQKELKSQLSEQNAILTEAQLLHIQDLKVSVKDEGDKSFNNNEFDTYKAKKVRQIQVGFVIKENFAAGKGYKNFKYQLSSPSGNVLFSQGKGGGSFQTADGKTTSFSGEKNHNFINENDVVYFYHNVNEKLDEGDYTITVWSEDHQVGKTKFTIE